MTLGFPEEQAFLKDAGGAPPARRSRPASATSSATRSRVRCVVANVELAADPASDDLVAEARRIFADELVDVGEVS